MIIKRVDGTVALNERESFFRFFDGGTISSSSSFQDINSNNLYLYNIPVPLEIKSTAFMLFVKSDFDEMYCSYQGGDTFDLVSRQDILKEYRIYTDISFGLYPKETDYGMILFDETGSVIYDSRVREAVYKDNFNFNSNFGTLSHATVSSAWYSMSTFCNFRHIEQISIDQSTFVTVGLQQISPSQTKTVTFGRDIIAVPQNTAPYFETEVMLLDPSYL